MGEARLLTIFSTKGLVILLALPFVKLRLDFKQPNTQ
jgi:hypothetical protein